MSDKEVRPLGDWLRVAYEPAAGTGCPPPERYLEAEMGDLPEDERRRLAEHARTCPACAAEQELARVFHEAPDESTVSADDLRHVVARLEEASPVRPASAAGMEPPAGKVVPFPARREPAPAVQPERPAASKVRTWRLAAAAALLMTGSLLVWRSQQPAPLPLPAPPGQSEVFRGADVEVLSPVGEMETVPTELRWEEKDGAASYRIRLLAVDDTVLWESTVTAPPARLPDEVAAQLQPAVAYVWTVEALAADGSRLAVSEPARFQARPEPEPAP